LIDAELVDDVLNHYGSNDAIVPLAHATIWDSGPSGRRGFDGNQVINVRAERYGHSDLFSIEKCVVNGKPFHNCTGAPGEITHLVHSYKQYWRPFLTLPRNEFRGIPDRVDPETTWRQLPWVLRGTLFPFVVLPLVLALIVLLLAAIGRSLWTVREVPSIVAKLGAVGFAVLLIFIAITWLWRRIRS
jgi:hypothetical protein